jgi:hypothetical protein
MVITNFAAGELSENLFGRIDIPQYYSGVSRLENFDVIPTGGIERRGGTERLLTLAGEGRLIPFYTDRRTHVLLYLTPGKIQVITNGTVQQTVTGGAQLPLYQSLEEITAVQYAQNFDTMILVHEQYQPLMVKYAAGAASMSVTVFEAHYRVETKTSGETDFVYEIDTTHEKYLRTPGNYPRCVSFYNGRLVFAGTINDPQRVFASRVNDIYSFATYKLFVTEQKEYISVFGNAFDGRDTIKLAEGQASKFVKPLPEYHVDSPYFPRNSTKAVAFLAGEVKELRVSHQAAIPGALSQAEVDAINSKIAAYEVEEQNKREYTIGRKLASNQFGGLVEWTLKIRTGAKTLIYIAVDGSTVNPAPNETGTYPLPDNAAEFIQDNAAYLVTFINALPPLNVSGITLNQESIAFAAANWAETIRDTMQMNFRGEMIFDIPEDIRIYIDANTTPGIDAYIPFYTRQILEDRYPAPDDGFTFEIASDMSDAIQWLALNKGIIIGTETAEWILQPDVTATTVYATRNSRYGSDRIQGTAVNDATCFFQSGKKALVEYYIPQQDTNFRVNNLALFSRNMLEESPAVEFDCIRSPYTRLFITRADGAVVTLLYERSTGTFAWGRLSTAGAVKSVAVLPGEDGNDDVYLAVKREGAWYLEVLREAAAVYLDSFREWTGNSAGYAGGAVIYDETGGKPYPLTEAPEPAGGHRYWIGYPYASRARSMPILANDRMRPNNIKSLVIRFQDSFLPRVLSLPNKASDTIPLKAPYSGIARVPFPGVWDTDVLFELVHDQPTRCTILAINAEVN